MKLYHACLNSLSIGDVVSVDNFDSDTTYYYQQLNSTKKDVEDILEQHRPTQYCSRKKSIFLFDDPKYCFYFAKNEYKNPQIHVYEVEAENISGGFPMCLVQVIYKRLHTSNDYLCIVDEYWSPQNEWQVKEYLATSVKITNEYACQDNNDIIARMHYGNDIQQSERI